jgi:hypothetical protein
MTLGFQTLPIKILACIPKDRYKKIGTIYVKDTCLQIPFAATRCLGSSSVARSLLDDWQARNKQENKKNKSNRTANRGILII